LSKDEADTATRFGSMRRKCDTCGGLATSVGGRAPPARGKRGDDVSWSGVNLIRSENEKKIHAIDSTTTNGWWKFKAMIS
jgi:hypothetical protein